jgi:uncharacterized protein
MDIKRIIEKIIKDYQLPLDGRHGLFHWGRVLDNALLIAEQSGADTKIVTLFALFHDSCRLNEGLDPEHGKRGAAYLKSLNGKYFTLADNELDLLETACKYHTSDRFHASVTIQTCWDADRLDLGRIGFTIDPGYLNTDFAKRKSVIKLIPAILILISQKGNL